MAAQKKLIAIIKPPKPVSQMSDEELEQFAKQVVAQTRVRIERTPS